MLTTKYSPRCNSSRCENVGLVDAGAIVIEHFFHRRAALDDRLRSQAFVEQVAAGVFGQRHVDVADVIDDLAIDLFRHALSKQRLPASMWKIGILRRLAEITARPVFVSP